jgi:putative transposase
VPAMGLERSLVFPPEAVREGEARVAPRLSAPLRPPRRGSLGGSGDGDETVRKGTGRVVSLSRASEREGNGGDVVRSEQRDKAAAALSRSARPVTGRVPARVTREGHNAYPGALTAALGEGRRQRTKRDLPKPREPDQRGLTPRIRPRGGGKRVEAAKRFCRGQDAVRHLLRPRSYRHAGVSLGQRRLLSTARPRVLLPSLAAASTSTRSDVPPLPAPSWGDF